jgi:hypothetical protein
MSSLRNWMSELKPTRKLGELWLPGSHDSGVYTDKEKGVDPGDSARCQYENIFEQARVGSRVFDIRVFLRNTGFFNRTKIPTMGHFFMDTAPLGSYGGTLEDALNDAGIFLTANKKEFLIFRIGHTECLAEVADVLEKFRIADISEKLPETVKKYTWAASTQAGSPSGSTGTSGSTGKSKPTGKTNATLFYRGTRKTGNLADVEVEKLRGKIVLLCDNENLRSQNFEPGDGYYLFDKYSTSPSNAQIRFCGKYGGSPVKASEKGKGNWSSEGSVTNAEEAWSEHQKHCKSVPDHLWWVYWQQTGGNVWENTSATTGMHNRLDNFLSRFRTGNLPHPNIIGQDFVERFTCSAIVKMNPDLETANFHANDYG